MSDAVALTVPGRSRFLETGVAALSAALLPAGRVWASDAPEVATTHCACPADRVELSLPP